MTSFATPGVYIQEIPVFPPSVAAVSTAVPAFIGYCTRSAAPMKTPVRVTSLFDYRSLFGAQRTELKLTRTLDAGGKVTAMAVAPESDKLPPQLAYAVQMYFENGGGPCWIHALGDASVDPASADFTAAIDAIEAVDEPTLLVFPDAVRLEEADHGAVVTKALQSCAKMKDRFTIADVSNAVAGGVDTVAEVGTAFRDRVTLNTPDTLKYGAAYFPYLRTTLRAAEDEALVLIKTAKDTQGGNEVDGPLAGKTMAEVRATDPAAHAAIRAHLDANTLVLPPSGAVAGLYARTDRMRGVWKAPANDGLALVTGTAVPVTNDLQDGLNIDAAAGKSVNAIRSFFGRGTLVWGARTLAGNDAEWRYVNVRRFANFVEESVAKACATFVFEPNDANTWVKVRAMVENFLTNQWRNGALQGAKPEDAFEVAVGLGQTMSAQDILDGLMIVEIKMAIVRPAEFILLRFMQKMPES